MKRASVLPKIAFTPTEDGALLVADRAGAKEVALVFFFALGVVINGYAFFLWELDETRRILSLVYAAVCLIALIGYDRDYRRSKRIRGASITIRPWPIRLGCEVKAQLRVRPQSPVAARLECVEVATSGRGKFEQTKRATVYTLELTDADWTFVVPDHLPPSLEVPGNRVVWQIAAMITTGDAEIPVAFDLLVIPEIAR